MTKRWLRWRAAGGTGAAAVVAAVAVASAAAGCSGPQLPRVARGEVVLTVGGGVKYGPFALGREDLEALPRAGFRAVDPVTGKEARYDGVALQQAIAERLEPTDGADTLVVRTAEKEALPLSPVTLRQYKPILADRIDGAPVAPQLAWPNLDQLGLQRDPRATLWWARKVVAIDLVAWDRTWGRALRPPPGSTDAARLGAGQYLLRCVACHRVSKVGGERGPALDGAAGRLGLPRFAAALRGHQAWPERFGTELSPGDEVAGQIHAFLDAVERSGQGQQDEPEPKEPRRGSLGADRGAELP